MVAERALRKISHNKYAYEKEMTNQGFLCDSNYGVPKVV